MDETALVVVIGWAQVLGSWKHTDQTGWIVNQHGQMLWTDPNRRIPVLELDQGRRMGVPLTSQAVFLCLFVGHVVLRSFKVPDPGLPESRC